MTYYSENQDFLLEKEGMTWIDSKYFKLNPEKSAIFVRSCRFDKKYYDIIKNYFRIPRRFNCISKWIFSEVLNQNLENLIWEYPEESPSVNKNSRYLKGSIPYSFKSLQKSEDEYAFYNSFCSKETLKKYLKILEELGYLKIEKIRKGYIDIHYVDLKKWIDVMKEYNGR